MLNGEEWARLNMFNRIISELNSKKLTDEEVSVLKWLKSQIAKYEERK